MGPSHCQQTILIIIQHLMIHITDHDTSCCLTLFPIYLCIGDPQGCIVGYMRNTCFLSMSFGVPSTCMYALFNFSTFILQGGILSLLSFDCIVTHGWYYRRVNFVSNSCSLLYMDLSIDRVLLGAQYTEFSNEVGCLLHDNSYVL